MLQIQIPSAPIGPGWFTQAFAFLQQLGLLESILPFILYFALLYAIIIQSGIFGAPGERRARAISTVIAVSIALIPVIQHALSPSPNDVISITNRFLPSIALLAIAILTVLVMIGIIVRPEAAEGGFWKTFRDFAPWIVLIIIVLIFIASLTTPFAPWANFFFILFDPTIVALVMAILVGGLVIAYVTSEK